MRSTEALNKARVIGKLTTLKVRQAQPAGPNYTKLYGDGGGLFLQVSPNGAKSWVFRFKTGKKLTVMGLGPVHTITLAEAREKARECRKLRLDGVNPLEQRRGKRSAEKIGAAKAMTFQACAEAYIEAHRAGWRNEKHAGQWPSTLGAYVYPVFGDLAVQAIDTGLVMRALGPIWNEKPETASRVRGRIESILDWATAREYRRGENPARWRGHLENLLPKKTKVRRVQHHAALPYPEVAAFVAELRQQDGVAARALEFCILTAARSGEVIGAKWNEINMAERLWTIPGSRMKAAKEHRLPLSDAAMAVIEQMQVIRSGDYVFPGARRGGLGDEAMLTAMHRMKRTDLTVHGLRSTFRDWAAECTAFPAEVAELALAHTVSNKVEAAYRRGDMFDKRRQLAEAWASFCAAQPVSGEIVPMRA